MKRIISIICLSVCGLFVAVASEFDPVGAIFLQVRLIDPTVVHHPLPKSPIVPPSIGIEGDTLYIYGGCVDDTLQLVDTDDTVVYSEEITDSISEIILPESLSGEYELQILQGNFCFYAVIELQ